MTLVVSVTLHLQADGDGSVECLAPPGLAHSPAEPRCSGRGPARHASAPVGGAGPLGSRAVRLRCGLEPQSDEVALTLLQALDTSLARSEHYARSLMDDQNPSCVFSGTARGDSEPRLRVP